MKKYLLLLMIFICSFSFSAEPVDFKAKLVKGEVFPEFVLEKLSGTKELSTEVFDKNKKTLIETRLAIVVKRLGFNDFKSYIDNLMRDLCNSESLS